MSWPGRRNGGRNTPRSGTLKAKMEEGLREYMGVDAVSDAMRRPAWVGDLHAERERSACRH